MSCMYCKPCGRSFIGPDSLNQHMKSDKHKKKVLRLSILNNSSGSHEETFTVSSTSLSSNAIECSVCSLRFNSLVDFQTHSVSQEHAQKVMEKSANSLSSDISSSISSSNFDGCNSDKNKTCDETDMILPAVEMCVDLKLHFPTVTSFSACNKSFSGPEPYKQRTECVGHIKKVQLEKNVCAAETNQTSKFSSDPCEKIFSGQVPYIQHTSSEIYRKKIQTLQYIEKSEGDFVSGTNRFNVEENTLKKGQNTSLYCKVCDIWCSDLFCYAQHLEGYAHLKKVRREKIFLIYTCKVCDKKFIAKRSVRRHLKTHAKTKPLSNTEENPLKKITFACEVCKKIVSSKRRLGPFACEVCDEVVSSKRRLGWHLKTHYKVKELPHAEGKLLKERTFACEVCNKKFYTENYLKRHLQTH